MTREKQGEDGCDAHCQLEAGSMRDCDLLGSPCACGDEVAGRCTCGWPLVGRSAWDTGLTGYLLPPEAQLSCANYSYYDYLLVPMQRRHEWMQRQLVSCECATDPSRQLAYEECAAQGTGCRACEPYAQYHDDALRRCVPCATLCAPGFQPDPNGNKCPFPVANTTAALALPTLAERQAYVGCVPCANAGRPGQVYVAGCDYTCERVATVPNNTLDYYCTVEQTAGGVCGGTCDSCAASYQLQWPRLQRTVGFYMTGCADAAGHTLARCDNRIPANANFSTSAIGVGNNFGCGWACNPEAYASEDGATCYACPSPASKPATCASGEMRTGCLYGQQQQSHFCQQCARLDAWRNLSALSQLYSYPPAWSYCEQDCQEGVAWSEQRGDLCVPCTRVASCAPGSSLATCTRRNDTACVPCPAPLAPNEEHVAPGLSCERRCAGGYYRSAGGACLTCGALACPPGWRASTRCLRPDERAAGPTCVSCGPLPTSLHDWGGECLLVCRQDYYQEGALCLPCNATACPPGTKAQCQNGTQACSPCANLTAGKNREFTTRGSCASNCSAGYVLPAWSDDWCVLRPPDAPAETTPPPSQTPPPRPPVPTRQLPHDAGQGYLFLL